MFLIEELKISLAKALSVVTGEDIVPEALEYPELSENGDLSFPCFSLAKKLKSAPPKIAADLVASLSSRAPASAGVNSARDLWDRAEAKGPYLNFFLQRDAIIKKVTENILQAGETYGNRQADRAAKVMVEYISPNNNKPLHLGHVRNGLIGAALSNLYESQGKKVARALLLNDRGLAIAKAMVAYMKWGNDATPDSLGKKGDHYLGDLYVMYEQAAKGASKGIEADVMIMGKVDEDLRPTYWNRVDEISNQRAELEEATHEIIRKWEADDAEIRTLWKTLSDWCEAGQHETYKRFGFHFDVEYKESGIYKEGKELVELGLKKGVFKKDETGAVFADLEAYKLPNKIVLRADGTSLYVTQDLYLAKKKFDEEGVDASVYVVGSEQNLHFQQLFKILELLGFEWASKVKHLSYGYVTLPEGRMKSREGTVVDADDLLSALEADAALEIKQRHATLPDDELVRRAHAVALAAIKFYFLEVDAASDMVYDPKASLSFTGKTGPYLQYMHARIKSMMRKATDTRPSSSAKAGNPGFLDSPVKPGNDIALSSFAQAGDPDSEKKYEFALAFALARFPEAVRRAAEQDRPSLVALHLYETAKAISALYENVPVLSAHEESRRLRLELLEAAAAVLKRGAELLGFAMPEEM